MLDRVIRLRIQEQNDWWHVILADNAVIIELAADTTAAERKMAVKLALRSVRNARRAEAALAAA